MKLRATAPCDSQAAAFLMTLAYSERFDRPGRRPTTTRPPSSRPASTSSPDANTTPRPNSTSTAPGTTTPISAGSSAGTPYSMPGVLISTSTPKAAPCRNLTPMASRTQRIPALGAYLPKSSFVRNRPNGRAIELGISRTG